MVGASVSTAELVYSRAASQLCPCGFGRVDDVECRTRLLLGVLVGSSLCSVDALNRVSGTLSTFTLNKFECSKQAVCCLKILAWNNGIGLRSYFVGLIELK